MSPFYCYSSQNNKVENICEDCHCYSTNAITKKKAWEGQNTCNIIPKTSYTKWYNLNIHFSGVCDHIKPCFDVKGGENKKIM